MYSNIRSVQILIALLKSNGIQHIVLSSGGSDIPLIHSLETDAYFSCYSVVDERSAAYFALGLAQASNKTTACICTSGSAVCNYLPGITEAFYQNAPVLAITADKNPYFQGQLEIQKIDQTNIFNGVVKKAVSLPLIRNEDDEWLCNRLVNEALLALTHHGKGPVHINIPIVESTDKYDCITLPKERVIRLINSNSEDNSWKKYAEKLASFKHIMVVVGQNVQFFPDDINILNMFFKKYNCIFAVEHLSNLECNGRVFTYPITEMHGSGSLKNLLPDIVISIGNNLSAYQLKPLLRNNFRNLENWLINDSGEVRDAYKCLTEIFECSVIEFFTKMVKFAPVGSANSEEYYQKWSNEVDKIDLPDFEFSNFYVASKLASIIPENSLVHLAILSSTRVMQFFKLAKGVKTYCNVGVLGIDGCFSTFAGQAAITNELSFLVIGDLSFFYDMNAAGLQSIGPNVRIILFNNSGGSEFHFFMGQEKIPTINKYVCAEHNKVAAGWISSLDYDYYYASSKEEFDQVITKFARPSTKPMFLEILTGMEDDAKQTREMYQMYASTTASAKAKGFIKKIVSDKQVGKIREILKVIRK